MVSRLCHTSVDAHDPYAQSLWWADVLGMRENPDDPNQPGHEECMIFSEDLQTEILFLAVPDDKQVKNRLHFDVRPTDRSRDEEVVRLIELGATQLADLRTDDGFGWVVLADPEGNEFCVLRSDGELADEARQS